MDPFLLFLKEDMLLIWRGEGEQKPSNIKKPLASWSVHQMDLNYAEKSRETEELEETQWW